MKKLLFVLGFFIVAGSAGACDLDTITVVQGLARGFAGLSLMAIGVM